MEDVSNSQNVTPLHSSDLAVRCPLSNSNAVSGSCDHNGGVLTSKDGDIKITVPKGAIDNADFVKFYIATDLYGPFCLPSQCQSNLVSPYYWIGVTASYRFLKPVKVEFQHYAVIKDPSHYQLLSCEDDDESYTMRPAVDIDLDLTVRDGTSLCAFVTHHFCSYCLFCHQDQVPTTQIGAFFLKPENFQHLIHFKVEIWFSFRFELCLKRIKELYKSRYILDARYDFEATCDKNSANYFEVKYSEKIDGWTVKHSLTTIVKTKKINFYNDYKEKKDLEANEEC